MDIKEITDIAALIVKMKNDSLTEEEKERLHLWLSLSERNRELYDKLSRDSFYLKKIEEEKKCCTDLAYERFLRRQRNHNRNNLHDVYCNTILRGILDLRYTENIREKEGGTYGVHVSNGSVKEPNPQYSMTMNFDCDPSKANHLKDLIYAEIEKIKKDGVTQEEVSKITLNMLKNFEQSKPHNSYWMNVIANYYITDVDNNDPKNYEDILKNLTPEDIQKFACKLFDNPDTIDLVFKPKK